MKNRLEDIKVGDSVMIPEWVGIGYRGGWRAAYFCKDFYIKHKVTKVTKTQFTANGVRFKKDGLGLGDNSSTAYPLGFTGGHGYLKVEVPTECQLSEKVKYERKIKPLKKYSTHIGKDEVSPLKAKNIDDALEADRLIQKAKWIINGKQQ